MVGVSSKTVNNPNVVGIVFQSDPVGFMNPTMLGYHFVLKFERDILNQLDNGSIPLTLSNVG